MARVGSEDYIRDKVVVYAHLRGWLIFVIDYGGWPDRLFLSPSGIHHWIEFKKPTGDLAKRQKHRRRQLEDRNVMYRLIDDIEDGKQYIDLHT